MGNSQSLHNVRKPVVLALHTLGFIECMQGSAISTGTDLSTYALMLKGVWETPQV